MPPRPVDIVLLRAPLLPVSALRDPMAALRRHPLGAQAIALASPDLAAALAAGARVRSPAAARAALGRYARRAAFRATPAGLLAGVGLARLGGRTRLRTGEARAHVRPSWQALAAEGRALLDQPAVRAHVRLRAAPSLLRGPEEVVWLAFDPAEPGGLVVESAELDPALRSLLDAARAPAPWPQVRAALRAALAGALPDDGAGAGAHADEDLDGHLLLLVDQGLLVHDLVPPLVGDPERWWQQRRQALPAPLRPPPVEAGARTAVLAIETRGPATLDRRAVERACVVAPLLFGLQQALTPPLAERALDPGLTAELAAIAEWQGVGAYDLAALVTGQHGVRVGAEADSGPPPALAPAAIALLAGLVTEALAAGRPEVALDPEALAAALEAIAPVTPPTFELLLAPAREPRGTEPGTGWLLGLHAPAGASLGRFLPALGSAGPDLVQRLTAAERDARPGEQPLDVAYAAAPALADLSVHPPARARVLALMGWAEGDALTAADLRLVIDPGAPEPLGLQAGAVAVAPAPMHRVRSTTAPPGLYRLLAGWSFARQHRPWALGWGPLADLPVLPRVTLAGFVVTPASWRIPDAASCRRPGAIARWRRRAGVPPQVQVGEGDELMWLDVTAPGAGGELARFAGGRAHEVWPPLDRTADGGGRRLEAVVAVVDHPAAEDLAARAAAIAHTARALRVPPPAEAPPPADWTSWRIYGAEQEQDAVLHEAVAPAVAEARAAGELDAWFFLRYRAPADPRPHLRLRARGGGARFARRLQVALSPLRARSAVVALESGPYFPETARFGGPEGLRAAEAVFQADSELALALLAAESEGPLELGDRRELVVLAADRLVRAFGVPLAGRRALADSRRRAFAREAEEDPRWPDEFRACARRLQAALAGPLAPPLARALAAFEAAVRPAVRPSDTALLPILLHLQAVRLAGLGRADEQAACVFWARALEGLSKRQTG